MVTQNERRPNRDTFPRDRANLASYLQEHGILPTNQRLEIASVLFERAQHLAADQVLLRVNRDGHRVSKATVYNTLGLFAEKGLIREVIVDPTRVFYDSNTQPHHHFFDVDTGELTDVNNATVPLTRLPDPPAGKEVQDIEVIIRVRHQGDESSPEPEPSD
jgi:Fur family iron response transcriptional regulator